MSTTLWVTEQDGVGRVSFPITGGIAFPVGVVTAAGKLVLTDAEGKLVPLQSEVLSHWPDGSIRWALLDFQTDLEAHETKAFQLTEGEAQQLPPFDLEDTVDGEPLPRLVTQPPVAGSFVRIVGADGTEWTRREAGLTEVERQNGLRTTVRTSGTVISPTGDRRIRWEARTDFYRGQPWTRTRFTYLVDGGETDINVKELAVVAQTEADEQPTYCFATAQAWARTAPLTTNRPAAIVQTDAQDSHIVAPDGELLCDQTLKNRGYVGVEIHGSGLALGLAEMWQSFPKALRATPGTLEVALWPSEIESEFVLAPGVARTHTLTLTPYQSVEQLDEFMVGINTPILPQMSVDDWNRTGIIPPLLSPQNSPVPFIEELSRAIFTGFTTFSTRANVGVWGLGELNWGDFRAESYEARQVTSTYGEGGVVWGNEEAQVPYGFLVQYLRTARIEYLLHGLACARHEADVDTIHDSPDPDLIGRQHCHSVGHTAGPVTISHEWTSGIALAYLLTGDGRLRAVLQETGDALLRCATEYDIEAFRARDGGWLLIALCALCEALDDPRYLEGGARVLQGLRLWIDQGATTLLPPAQHVHSPVHLFIALTGVADYLRLTGDEAAREALIIGGQMTLERGRNEAGFFFIADGQAYRNTGTWSTCHSLPVLNTLYDITGDRKWIEVGVHQTRLLLRLIEAHTGWDKEDNWAQGGIYLAYAFSFFETARQLGLLEDI